MWRFSSRISGWSFYLEERQADGNLSINNKYSKNNSSLLIRLSHKSVFVFNSIYHFIPKQGLGKSRMSYFFWISHREEIHQWEIICWQESLGWVILSREAGPALVDWDEHSGLSPFHEVGLSQYLACLDDALRFNSIPVSSFLKTSNWRWEF